MRERIGGGGHGARREHAHEHAADDRRAQCGRGQAQQARGEVCRRGEQRGRGEDSGRQSAVAAGKPHIGRAARPETERKQRTAERGAALERKYVRRKHRDPLVHDHLGAVPEKNGEQGEQVERADGPARRQARPHGGKATTQQQNERRKRDQRAHEQREIPARGAAQPQKQEQEQRKHDLRPRVHRMQQAQFARARGEAVGDVGQDDFEHAARKREYRRGSGDACIHRAPPRKQDRHRAVQQKPRAAERAGKDGERPTGRSVDEKQEDEIRRKLRRKTDRRQQTELQICKPVQPHERHEQDGRHIGDDRLIDDPRATGAQGSPFPSLVHAIPFRSKSYP